LAAIKGLPLQFLAGEDEVEDGASPGGVGLARGRPERRFDVVLRRPWRSVVSSLSLFSFVEKKEREGKWRRWMREAATVSRKGRRKGRLHVREEGAVVGAEDHHHVRLPWLSLSRTKRKRRWRGAEGVRAW
jgi:hypothetical protein